MKYAYITEITNILVKLEKTLQTNIAVNGLYDTRLCGYSSQCWSEAFLQLLKFLLLSFAHIYNSQDSVKMHLRCCGIYNNHVIANCLQSVPVKEF